MIDSRWKMPSFPTQTGVVVNLRTLEQGKTSVLYTQPNTYIESIPYHLTLFPNLEKIPHHLQLKTQ
jgi:hypothetical protein